MSISVAATFRSPATTTGLSCCKRVRYAAKSAHQRGAAEPGLVAGKRSRGDGRLRGSVLCPRCAAAPLQRVALTLVPLLHAIVQPLQALPRVGHVHAAHKKLGKLRRDDSPLRARKTRASRQCADLPAARRVHPRAVPHAWLGGLAAKRTSPSCCARPMPYVTESGGWRLRIAVPE